MNKVLIINTHLPYGFSEGKLSEALVSRIEGQLVEKGYEVEHSYTSGDYDIEQEIVKHVWADVIVIQIPVNWFSVPWPMKKYMDDVFTAGLDGRICVDDGRTSDAPKKNYGTGGGLKGKKYMLSFTFNAPAEAFGDPDEYLMQGKQVDDLFLHMHANYRFLGMSAIPSFSCHDVIKNPEVNSDFERLSAHLANHF